jgi:hypothetical protein
MNTYHLEKAELNGKWDQFVNESDNGTIFSLSDYLVNLNVNLGTYYCLKNREIRAALIVAESDDGREALLHDFIIYNGVIYGPPAHRQNRSQRLSEHFAIATAIAMQLPEIYRHIELSLHPSVIDVRPFLWVNYGTDKPKYHAEIRYTSYVQIEDFAKAEGLEDISIYRNASNSRRQEIRYASREAVVTREHDDVSLFVNFYRRTMLRQNIQKNSLVFEELHTLIKGVIQKNLGKMFTSFTAKGVPGSMAFFGFDNKRAYYIFGANDPDLRDAHTGTAVMWDAFRVLSLAGIKEIDLEGVNSPYRGWFKLSFGGNIIPYYQMTFKNAG